MPARAPRTRETSLRSSAPRRRCGRARNASASWKSACAASNEERAYLAAIVDSSDDAIISKDLNGIVRSCNAAAERLFGYPAHELIGQPIRVLIPSERQAEEDEIIARIRNGVRVDHFETVRVTKDGRLVDVSLTVSPVRDASGRVIGASKIARDITDQKRAILERDRLLEAERAARAEAERASRVKDDFVAMVSHELRTPLNAILGWTQLMARSAGDPALVQRGLDVVARNTRLQAQLISDLLDISRIVAGKLSLEMESVDLGSIVAQRHRDPRSRGQDQGRGHRPVDGRVAGHGGGRLRPAAAGGVEPALERDQVHAARAATCASSCVTPARAPRSRVADDGAGIRPEFLPHVFDRFHQADRSITRRFGGLGLGLSIVKHLVDVHGGTVRAESPGEGQGSTFTIALPASVGVPSFDRRIGPTPGSPRARRCSTRSGCWWWRTSATRWIS